MKRFSKLFGKTEQNFWRGVLLLVTAAPLLAIGYIVGLSLRLGDQIGILGLFILFLVSSFFTSTETELEIINPSKYDLKTKLLFLTILIGMILGNIFYYYDWYYHYYLICR